MAQTDPCAHFFTHDPAEPFNERSVVERDGSLLSAKFRVSLLLMKDHPELIARYSEPLAKRQLATEMQLRKEVDALVQYPPLSPPFNTAHPVFAFEWSDLAKSQPIVASGAALDVYLRENATWPFLEKTAGWDKNAPEAWVGMFLFPRSSEVGRDALYAAREVQPILESQLLLASKRESAELWFPLMLAASSYDFDSASRTLSIKTDLLAPSSLGSSASAQGRMGYKAPDAFGTAGAEDEQHPAGGFRYELAELANWRQMVGFQAAADRLALDHQLRINSVAVNGKIAEADRFGREGDALRLRVFVTVERTEAEAGSTTQFVLYARVKKVDVVDERGNVVATVPASLLPKPGSLAAIAPREARPSAIGSLDRTKGANCRAIQMNVERSQRASAANAIVAKADREKREQLNHLCNEQAAREADKAGPSPGPAWQAALKSARESCLASGPTQVAANVPPPVPENRTSRQPRRAGPEQPRPAPAVSRDVDRGITVEPAPNVPAAPIAIPHNYALIFATSDYKEWPHLENPVPDGDAIAQTLTSLYGFKVEELRNPTREQINAKLREYTRHRFDPQDQLLIFFSGHGYFDSENNRGYIVPTAAPLVASDPDHTQLLAHDTILGFVNHMPARHIVLFMDACFAGTLDRHVRDAGFRGTPAYSAATLPELLQRGEPKRTRRYFVSGGKDFVPDGVPGHHSPFVAALLSEMNDAANQKGYMTLEDIQQALVTVRGPQPLWGDIEDSNEFGANFIMMTPRAAAQLNAVR